MHAIALDTLPPRRAERPQPIANATVVHREPITDDIQLVRLLHDDGPVPFAPGQYVSLGLARDGGWIQRPYSPANSPGAPELELVVRRVIGGRLSPALCATSAGTRVRIGPAKGLFRLIPDDHRVHLLLGTGTGIAPLVSMTTELLARPEQARVVLVHGVRVVAELAFRDRLQALAADARQLTYVPTVSRPGDALASGTRGGRALDLLPEVWEELALDPGRVVAYLCGNPAVVDGAADWLTSRGLAPSAIRSEEYWPAARPDAMA
jgi:ferredoxin-NADP reductase